MDVPERTSKRKDPATTGPETSSLAEGAGDPNGTPTRPRFRVLYNPSQKGKGKEWVLGVSTRRRVDRTKTKIKYNKTCVRTVVPLPCRKESSKNNTPDFL